MTPIAGLPCEPLDGLKGDPLTVLQTCPNYPCFPCVFKLRLCYPCESDGSFFMALGVPKSECHHYVSFYASSRIECEIEDEQINIYIFF